AQERLVNDAGARIRSHQVLRFLTDHGVTRQVLMDIGAFVEMGIVVLSAVIAKYLYLDLYLGQHSADIWGYLGVGVIGACVTTITLRRQHLYEAERFSSQSAHFRRFFVGLFLGFLVLGAIGYLVKVS